MAITILDATSVNLSNRTTPTSIIPMSYTLNNSSKWIYCNYPESINSTAIFGDSNYGNKFLNQQTVSSGEMQVFYSYWNNYSSAINFGIQIYNPNSTSTQITKTNSSHADSVNNTPFGAVTGGSWTDFFNSTASSPVTISSGGSYWILEKSIPTGAFFSGNLRFQTTNTVIVTVYAYLVKSNINGTATAYPYSNTPGDPYKQYSGNANGYYFTASRVTLNASTLINNSKCFKTHYKTYSPSSNVKINNVNKSDLTPINIVGTSYAATPTGSDPLGNLGNWCAQYYIPIRLNNDTGNPVTFTGYVKTGQSGQSTFVINSGYNNTKYGIVQGPSTTTWRWMQITLNPSDPPYDDAYQFILGTNGYANVDHIWTAV